MADDRTTLAPVETEQVAIRQIRAMRDQGRSYRAMAEELTRRSIPTKKGNAKWTHQAIASVLKRATTRSAGRREDGRSQRPDGRFGCSP